MKNNYEIRGTVTAIFLTQKDGSILETLIDTEDLQKVKEFPNTWYAFDGSGHGDYYAVANGPTINKKRKGYKLHRFIFDDPENKQIDHINHDTLCNMKSNLRIVTPAENQQNRIGSRRDNNTSGIRGVSWDKKSKKWRVQMQVKGKKISVGSYDDIIQARESAEEAYSKLMPYSEHAGRVIS